MDGYHVNFTPRSNEGKIKDMQFEKAKSLFQSDEEIRNYSKLRRVKVHAFLIPA